MRTSCWRCPSSDADLCCLLLVVALLEAIVGKGSLDGVLCEHCRTTQLHTCAQLLEREECTRLTWAVEFNRWKAKLFSNVRVLDLQSFIHLRRGEGGTQIVPKRNNKIYSKSSKSNNLTDLPFTHSVARELEAMAEPQPNVLNLASTIFPWLSTSIWKVCF